MVGTPVTTRAGAHGAAEKMYLLELLDLTEAASALVSGRKAAAPPFLSSSGMHSLQLNGAAKARTAPTRDRSIGSHVTVTAVICSVSRACCV